MLSTIKCFKIKSELITENPVNRILVRADKKLNDGEEERANKNSLLYMYFTVS